jgi:hypothetical protein
LKAALNVRLRRLFILFSPTSVQLFYFLSPVSRNSGAVQTSKLKSAEGIRPKDENQLKRYS